MGKASFEKVEKTGSSAAFGDNKKLRLVRSFSDSTSDTVSQHIYIIFSEDISIEEGIESIEREVLSGDVLRVSRFDVRGHAAVAIVSLSQTRQIERLPEVRRVKVMEAHHPNDVV